MSKENLERLILERLRVQGEINLKVAKAIKWLYGAVGLLALSHAIHTLKPLIFYFLN